MESPVNGDVQEEIKNTLRREANVKRRRPHSWHLTLVYNHTSLWYRSSGSSVLSTTTATQAQLGTRIPRGRGVICPPFRYRYELPLPSTPPNLFPHPVSLQPPSPSVFLSLLLSLASSRGGEREAGKMSNLEDLDYYIMFPSFPPSPKDPTLTTGSQDQREEFVFVYKEDKRPVIVLLGWAGCQDKYLAKYSAIYEEKRYWCFAKLALPPFNRFFFSD